MSIDILTDLIVQWGMDRRIIQNGSTMSQAIKSLEETTELLDAVNRNDRADIIDALGDVYVTLVMVAGTYGLELDECIESAYNEIKDRKGYLREDGTFIKDEV